MTLCAQDNKFYSMPDVGETVICLFATNDGTSGEGWIIGSRFHDKSVPNAKKQDVTRIDFKDGTNIEYDRKSHAMKIELKGTLEITCDREIKITSKSNVIIRGATIQLNE